MPSLKPKEIKAMNPNEVEGKIKEFKKELIKMNAQIATGTIPKSPGEVKNVKKNIARLLTISMSKNKSAKSEKKSEVASKE